MKDNDETIVSGGLVTATSTNELQENQVTDITALGINTCLPSINQVYSATQLQDVLEASNPPYHQDILCSWICSLTRPEDRYDIEQFCKSFPSLTSSFIPIRSIGEGTFSTVYLAIDVQHYRRDNSDWIGASLQDQTDTIKLWALVDRLEALRTQARSTAQIDQKIRKEAREQLKSSGISSLIGHLRHYVLKEWLGRAMAILKKENCTNIDSLKLAQTMKQYPPHFVAIKRINATSSPARILDELSYLRVLGGRNNVIPIVTASRFEDQVLVVFPYFHHDDFRDSLPWMDSKDISVYMRLLFESLAWIHQQGIIHRDIKPSNFLFSMETTHPNPKGILVDFGLAQRETKHSKARQLKHKSVMESIKDATRNLPPNGAIMNDPRPPMKASRAGTRGFRAPEVLFKCQAQGVAIDIWSAGVILLTLLTRRYPFFQSSDDQDALVEIACLFGRRTMQSAARTFEREFVCTVPSVPEEHSGWRNIICSLIPEERHCEIETEALDLLDKCMCLDPAHRITAKEALKHSFLTKYNNNNSNNTTNSSST